MSESWFQTGSARGNVVFNFQRNPSGEFEAFASGYHDAGKKLARALGGTRVDNKGFFACADYHGYPILFLYRHALELSLKAVVYRGASLLHLAQKPGVDTSRLFRDHRLSIWVQPVAKVFRSVGWRFDAAEMGDFESLVREVEEVDPLSYNFRYPVNKDGDGALPHHTIVNVLEVARRLDTLIPVLLNCADVLEDYRDQLGEAEYELARAFEE